MLTQWKKILETLQPDFARINTEMKYKRQLKKFPLFSGGLTIFLHVWLSSRKRSFVIRPKIVKT